MSVVLSVVSVAGINGVSFVGTVNNAFELNSDWLEEATRLSISEVINYSEIKYALFKQEYLTFDESIKFDYDSLKTVFRFVTSDDFKLELLELEEKEIKKNEVKNVEVKENDVYYVKEDETKIATVVYVNENSIIYELYDNEDNFLALTTINKYDFLKSFSNEKNNIKTEEKIKGGNCMIKENEEYVLINNANKTAFVVRVSEDIMFELYEGDEMIGLETLEEKEFLKIFNKKETKGGNKMKLNIQLFAGQNNKMEDETMKGLKDLLLNGAKETTGREEILKERILKEINEKELVRDTKIITNSYVGRKTIMAMPFSDLLELSLRNETGINYLKALSENTNNKQGKSNSFITEYATAISNGMTGMSRYIMQCFIETGLMEKNNISKGANLVPNMLQMISANALAGESAKEVDLSPLSFYRELVDMANNYGLKVISVGDSINGYNIAYLESKEDATGYKKKVAIPVPEFKSIDINGIPHVFALMGENVYSGSTTEKEVSNNALLGLNFSEDEIKHGIFRNTKQTFMRLIESIMRNFKELKLDSYVDLFFNPKKESEDIITNAFFVRACDYSDIKNVIEGKENLPMKQKLYRLLGNSMILKSEAFDFFVVNDYQVTAEDNIFMNIETDTTGNQTIGGGSGRTGLYVRVINNLQRVLRNDLDKLMANAFASCPFIQFKGSRNNNPDGDFLNKKYDVTMINYLGQEIGWYTKAVTAVFINTDRIPAEYWNGTRMLNTLDNYFMNTSVKLLLETINGIKDQEDYVINNSKLDSLFRRFPGASEKIAKLIKFVIGQNKNIKNIGEYLYDQILELVEGREKMATKIANKIMKLPEIYAGKISVAALKGTFIELKVPMSVKAIDEDYAFLNEFMNETMIISNETYHKPEFAVAAMVFQPQVFKQIKEGKETFVVKYDDSLPARTLDEEDGIKVMLNFNGFEIEAFAIICPCNVHDHKNNLVSQGASTMKQIAPNLQFFNSVRGSYDINQKWFMKNSKDFRRSILAAGYTIEFGKWTKKNWEGETLYVPANLLKEVNEAKVKYGYNFNITNDIKTANAVYKADAFAHDKLLFVPALDSLKKFDITGNIYHNPVFVKSNEIGINKDTIDALYAENEVLFYSQLQQNVMTESGNKKVWEQLALMTSKNLTSFIEANWVEMRGISEYNEDGIFEKTQEGLIDVIEKIRAIEIEPGRFIVFEPSMEKIAGFLSKELNTVLRAISVLYDDETIKNIAELVFARKISNIEDFYNYCVNNFEFAKFRYFSKIDVSDWTKFDHEHNVNGFTIANDIKEKIVSLTTALNSIEYYHQEKLFTKKAKDMYFRRLDGFYATAITIDCDRNCVHINPNSEGLTEEFLEEKYSITMRYPTTGELGYGLRIVWDTTIPENTIGIHPSTLEQMMGDVDGDCLVVLPVPRKVANDKIFKQMDIDLEAYFNGYKTQPGTLFKKWNKEFAKTGLDLTAEAILERQAAQRQQLQFNPEFVGLITSMNMSLCDVIWEKFVTPAIDSKNKNKIEEAKNVYNFFVNVVQKQLSQIPIAAKNTTAAGLAAFKETMNNIDNLMSIEDYNRDLEAQEAKAKKENKNEFEALLGTNEVKELSGYYMDFLNITGWDSIEGVESLGLIDMLKERK